MTEEKYIAYNKLIKFLNKRINNAEFNKLNGIGNYNEESRKQNFYERIIIRFEYFSTIFLNTKLDGIIKKREKQIFRYKERQSYIAPEADNGKDWENFNGLTYNY